MKKLLVLIVFTAVFLHFYPQEELTLWYEKHKNELLNSVNQSTDTKIRLKAGKIYQDLEPKFNQFKPKELEYLKAITSDRATLLEFNTAFCENNEPNANLHIKNQKLVCAGIRKYQSLL